MIVGRKIAQKLSENGFVGFSRCFASLPQQDVLTDAIQEAQQNLKLPSFDYIPKPYKGPSPEEVLKLRQQHMSSGVFHYYKKPLMIVEGKQQYLFDETGRRYLDAFAGIVTVSVGHCHPAVVDAIVQQTKLLQHTTAIYLNDEVVHYAKELTDRMPGNLKCAILVNSGSEANDLAMLIARVYTGNYEIIALRNAYHGLSTATMGSTGHSTWKYNVAQGFGIHHALNPNPYRGPYGNDGPRYAQDVQELLQSSAAGGKVAAFMSETIQGVGGAVQIADGYLQPVYKMIRDAGGLCIADEVQTGFGRLGSHYWGFETQGVVPDIVTLAKGIGNGVPLGAVVTTQEIGDVIKRALYFNTFGGNPVCCAAGRAVLRVVDEEQIQLHCAHVGQYLKSRLQSLQEQHDIIGDVRGMGLMLGVELVKDRSTKEAAKQQTIDVMEKLKDMGVLIGKGGFFGNVLRIKPPMCFNKQDADYLCDALDIALKGL
eukprot:TRINITY_DN35677_c0_g3_i1.p1 TRINITY_DN35677_c0_g3~~TRINITY_DN35677_c0_g3_i1.p1  ORF type:complete len:483 (+),score=72.96 TRINITY_DN35677_c0_g3_i1:132-1580(+)